MSSAATVAVTGANGFIGLHLVAALQQRGITVRPLLRKPDPHLDTGIVVGDLTEAGALSETLAQVDCVVHCAGMAHVTLRGEADLARASQINVEATRKLAAAAATAGVKQFIFLSSAKVMGDRSGPRPWTESDPIVPADPYGRSKAAAESALAEVAAASGLGVTVLRPPLVYGPGVRANFLRLLALADTPWPLPLASATAPRSMVYVGNLAAAVIACLGRQEALGQTFFVTDADDWPVARLLQTLRAQLGRPHRLLPCPAGLLELGAAAAGRREELHKLLAPLSCSSARLQTRLGWRPPVPVEQALRITVDWYRDHGRSARGQLR
jgi:nucleoside-diphosphate-sugar epimerase